MDGSSRPSGTPRCPGEWSVGKCSDSIAPHAPLTPLIEQSQALQQKEGSHMALDKRPWALNEGVG